MRTRLVRVRRRPRGVLWAVLFLVISMAAYIRVSAPALERREDGGKEPEPAERVSEVIAIEPLSIYLVSFGGYDVMNSAKVEAARYVPRGAAGYVLKKEKLYVIGAGYERREEAEKACVSLAAQEGLACAVIDVFSPKVEMRMTAGRLQIEAFAEAEKALRSSALALGRLAFSVDQGDASLAQAQEVVQTHLEKITAAKDALEAQAQNTESGLFKGMGDLLDEMVGQMEQMLTAEKRMIISSRLKYLYVDVMVRETGMMNALLQ